MTARQRGANRPSSRQRLGLAGAAFALSVVAAMPAAAQTADPAALQQRLDRLERELRTLNRQLTVGGAPAAAAGDGAPNPAVAQLQVRLAALEEEVRAITGAAERLSHEIDQIRQRHDKVVSDLEMRLQTLERGGSGSASNAPTAAPPPASSPRPAPAAPATGRSELFTPPPPPTIIAPATKPPAPGTASTAPENRPAPAPRPPAAAPPLPEGNPQQQYDYAFGLLQQGNYAQAQAAFEAFLQAHPQDRRTDNARYWLAESHYGRGDWVTAAKTFAAAYQANKTGPKAGDALLKLGMSLGRLDNRKEACETFRELARAFPDSNLAVRKRGDQEERRLGCR